MCKTDKLQLSNIKFDERIDRRDIVTLYFNVNDDTAFYMHMKKKKGIWKPYKIFHHSANNERGKNCPLCGGLLSIGYICEELSKKTKLNSLSKRLMEDKRVKIKAIFKGVTI